MSDQERTFSPMALPGTLAWFIVDPKLHKGNGFDSVHFAIELAVLKGDGPAHPIIRIPGWRVQRGYLNQPSRKAGREWIGVLSVLDKKAYQHIGRVLADTCKEYFPTVEFPEVVPVEEPVHAD